MHKSDLIDVVSKSTELSKTDARKVIESTLSTISQSLKKGEDVRLIGFGSFGTSKRDARKGKNPRTGETIKIPARTVLKFTASKELKATVNK